VQLEKVTEDKAFIRLSQQTESSKHFAEVSELRVKLQRESELRQIDSESRTEMKLKMEDMERKMEMIRQERENAMFIANERAQWARMSEVCVDCSFLFQNQIDLQVRLQALAQETVYWRQFALESDRQRYRSYMASHPFQEGTRENVHRHGSPATATVQASPPETELKTPAGGCSEIRQVDTVTPTKRNGVTQSLMTKTSTDSEG
jgi:hypothetical protein